jgi:predicted enzyme related to lactoylglutathione lyase
MNIRNTIIAALAAPLLASTLAAQELKPSPGDIWWSEYLAQDPTATSNFYASVIGWQVKTMALEDIERAAKPGEKPYVMMMSGPDERAGLMQLMDADYPGARQGWFNYFYVDNLEQAMARAVQQGGKVIREPSEVTPDTEIAIIQDPEGILIGLASAL